MNGLTILLIVLAAFLAAYGVFGAQLAKKWGVNPSRKTPAIELEDGRDYVPARTTALLLRHVAVIAGPGLIGAQALASMYGRMPALLGVGIVGGLLSGMVCFAALFASVRHDGRGIGEVMEQHISKRSKQAFLALAEVMALLMTCAALGAIGIGLVHLDGWPVEAISRPLNWTTMLSAFGAVLGLGALVSAETTAKRLRSERDARRIGLGGALLAAYLSVIVLIGAEQTSFGASLTGLFGLPGGVWSILAALVYAWFCLVMLAAALRLGRMTVQSLAGDGRSKLSRMLKDRRVSWLIAFGLSVLLIVADIDRILPLIGPAGLLTAAAAMTACAVWFKHIGRSNRLFVVWMLILFAAAGASMTFLAVGCVSALLTGAGTLSVEGVRCAGVALLAVPALVIAVDGVRALCAGRA